MFKKVKNNIKKFWAWRMRTAKTKKDVVMGSMAGRLLFIGASLGIMAVVAPPAVVVIPVALASAIVGGIVGWKAVKVWKNHKKKSAAKKNATASAPQNGSAEKSGLGNKSVEKKFNVAVNSSVPDQAVPEAKPAVAPKPPQAA